MCYREVRVIGTSDDGSVGGDDAHVANAVDGEPLLYVDCKGQVFDDQFRSLMRTDLCRGIVEKKQLNDTETDGHRG